MKTKMSLSAEMDLTQDSVVQLTCWCGQIALHELWGLGRTRLDRITRRKELLGSQSLAVVMQPDKNGSPRRRRTVIEKEQQPLHASSSEWEKNHETDLHQREADAMRERVHGGGPVCHYPGGARSQTPEERQAQHRAPAAAECGARAALPGAKRPTGILQ